MNDGGKAFPRPGDSGAHGWSLPQDGMSLRDYFAANAITECIRVAADQTPADGGEEFLSELFNKAAAYAYALADAMIAYRCGGDRDSE